MNVSSAPAVGGNRTEKLLRFGRLVSLGEVAQSQRREDEFQASTRQPPDLSAVDAVWCIALDRGNGVDPRAVSEFIESGLGDRLEFYVVRKPTEADYREHANVDPGEASGASKPPLAGFGCHTSHQDLSRLALARGYKRILVFEEDAVFNPDFVQNGSWESILREAKKALRKADVALLGSFPLVASPVAVTAMGTFRKVKALGLHGYVLGRSGMEKFSELDFGRCLKEIPRSAAAMGGGIDFWMASRMNCVGAFPSIVRQRGGESSQASQRQETFWGTLSNWAMGTRLWQETFFFPRAMEAFSLVWPLLAVVILVALVVFRRRRRKTPPS